MARWQDGKRKAKHWFWPFALKSKEIPYKPITFYSYPH